MQDGHWNRLKGCCRLSGDDLSSRPPQAEAFGSPNACFTRFSGLVVVVGDLYSASHSARNALIVPLRRKKMSFQRRSEVFGTPRRVPERVWKRVPFHRTCNGESPTTETCCDGVVEPSTGDGWPEQTTNNKNITAAMQVMITVNRHLFHFLFIFILPFFNGVFFLLGFYFSSSV